MHGRHHHLKETLRSLAGISSPAEKIQQLLDMMRLAWTVDGPIIDPESSLAYGQLRSEPNNQLTIEV